MRPKVSVIIGVFNGERYLRDSIESLFVQTFGDIEIIVVDDGSTDGTSGILASLRDSRLRVIRQQNRGLAASLNAAARVATAGILARHDADDISLPHRLARQLARFEALPRCAVLGTWMIEIDADGRELGIKRVGTSPGWIRLVMTYRDPFFHPTVMIRREALEAIGGYDESIRYSQDTDLWRRIVLRFDVANLGETLYKYRIHPDKIGETRRREQQCTLRDICRQYRDDYIKFYSGLRTPTTLERLTRAFVALQNVRDWNRSKFFSGLV